MTFQHCLEKGTGAEVSKDQCANRLGRWVTYERVPVNIAAFAGTVTTIAPGTTVGWSLKFTAQGSGLKNETIGPFDVIRPAS